MSGPYPRYPELHATTCRLACSVLLGAPREFGKDAKAFVARLDPPLQVSGSLPTMDSPKCLILANHYCRGGFRAWWIALAISAALPVDIHWLMTEGWTYPDPVRSRTLAPLIRRLFRRVSRMYGFTTMPPMPPRPSEARERADAVRAVLRLARRSERVAIGLAPEGSDSDDGRLMPPPQGVGRFIALLGEAGLRPIPVGVYEDDDRLCLAIGPPFPLPGPSGDRRSDLDQQVASAVMRAIAACMPARLRGIYA